MIQEKCPLIQIVLVIPEAYWNQVNHSRNPEEKILKSFKRDPPKVDDGTWRELSRMRRHSRRMRVKEGRLGGPSVNSFPIENKSFSIGMKLISGHTLHFVPSMPIGYAVVLDGLCIFLLSWLKKITVHSFHYPARRDGPSGFKRSEESDSVFFFSLIEKENRRSARFRSHSIMTHSIHLRLCPYLLLGHVELF